MKKINRLIEENKSRNQLFQPLFYRLTNADDKREFNHLIEHTPALNVFDEIEGQLQELIKLRSPKIKFKKDQLEKEVQLHF